MEGKLGGKDKETDKKSLEDVRREERKRYRRKGGDRGDTGKRKRCKKLNEWEIIRSERQD